MLSDYNGNQKRDPFATVTVWVIEDNAIYRRGIVDLIDEESGMKCTGQFETCEDALEKLNMKVFPNVVLMDIGLPGMSGIEGIKSFKSMSPATEIIMITVHDDYENIFTAICSGANGYILKTAPERSIIKGIKDVVAGGSPMNSTIARKIIYAFTHQPVSDSEYGLSSREEEILNLLVDGIMIKQIADKLFLSTHTIDGHLRRIYAKLQVHSRSEAVAKVLKNRKN